MDNYTVAEEYTLPSKGLVYNQKVNPVVKIASMTTEHEMRRLAPSDRAYKNICEIIDDCILDDIGISSYDLCLADYQFLLHRLRIVTYGSNYKLMTKCPFCGAETEKNVDLTSLEVVEYDPQSFSNLLEFKVPRTGHNIVIRMQTPRMIDDVNERVKEVRKKTRNQSVDPAFLFTVQSLIVSVDGKTLDPVKMEDFCRTLPMMDTNYIMKKAEKLVESFGIKTSLDFECPVCGLDYTGSFRVTSEFFGPSIDE